MKLNPDELATLAANMRASEEVEVLLDDEQHDRLFKTLLEAFGLEDDE
jgi:hypothetical protein